MKNSVSINDQLMCYSLVLATSTTITHLSVFTVDTSRWRKHLRNTMQTHRGTIYTIHNTSEVHNSFRLKVLTDRCTGSQTVRINT